MGFNLREYVLPPGTLIHFHGLGFNERLSFSYTEKGIRTGDVAMVIKHHSPFLLDLIVLDRQIQIHMEDMVDRIGWTGEFTPIYCGSGLREYPKWYPDYYYDKL